jgi:hypothetical protein
LAFSDDEMIDEPCQTCFFLACAVN